MSSASTLNSLAVLRSYVDYGRNYLDLLRPFVKSILSEIDSDKPVTDKLMASKVQENFGLDVPSRTIQIILGRIQKEGYLNKDHGKYFIQENLELNSLEKKFSEVNRHIQALAKDLIDFSEDRDLIFSTKEDAVDAICEFLDNFQVSCLDAYLRDSPIPDINQKNENRPQNILIAKFIKKIKEENPERFESFAMLLQGYMLSNALICPDLANVPETFNDVTFYFDTPIMLSLFGLDGKPKVESSKRLLRILKRLDSDIACFWHTRTEIERVIKKSAKFINKPFGKGGIVKAARKKDITKSDLITRAGRVEEKIADLGIELKKTPELTKDRHEYQIDEENFEEILEKEIPEHNRRAKLDDIKSFRSIYLLREGRSPTVLEKSKAVFVTSNSAFAKAANNYGKRFKETKMVSPVITDFSLTNLAWLKAPMEEPDLQKDELLAFSYAALEPSDNMLSKFLKEAEKLHKKNDIDEKELQLLRSDPTAEEELMDLTLGNLDEVTEETVTETLRRVTENIKEEERKKRKEIEEKHQDTLSDLEDKEKKLSSFRKKLKKISFCIASSLSWTVFIILAFIVPVGIYLLQDNPDNNFGMWEVLWVVTYFSLVALNLVFGIHLKLLHKKLKGLIYRYIKTGIKKIVIDVDQTQD